MPRPAVFLDRDGVIVKHVHYLHRTAEIALIPGAADAIRRLNARNVPAVVVTNQSAVARGMLSEADLRAIHDELSRMLESEGARIDGIYYCPHHPDFGEPPYRRDCECRKPKPGLLLQAASELAIDLGESAMVGDSITDIAAGRQAGCRTAALVLTGDGRGERELLKGADHQPDFISQDIAAAIDRILQARESKSR